MLEMEAVRKQSLLIVYFVAVSLFWPQLLLLLLRVVLLLL